MPIHSSNEKLPATFVGYAADVLGDTTNGLSGSNIVKLMREYAFEYGISAPHSSYPFDASNKRSALSDNLMAFDGPQQYRIILELCDHRSLLSLDLAAIKKLKFQLVQRHSEAFGALGASAVETSYIEETRHWLKAYPGSLKLFEQAAVKLKHRQLDRNLLDDLRLSLELLLKDALDNSKSLENQLAEVGNLVKTSGGSKEFSNMFGKLLEYYSKYQNEHVKHSDSVVPSEIEFMFEITSAFMRNFVRMAAAP